MKYTKWTLVLAAALSSVAVVAHAADPVAPATQAQASVAADAFIKDITNDVFATVRGDKAIQAGDLRKVIAVIDAKILPHVNFQRMTASAVGKNWRQATPEQQKRLQEEFKNLLIYTYAGAAAQIKDQTVEYRPLRARPEDTEVVVRSIVRGQGEPIQIDYRLERSGNTWKVYDVNVLGAWLVQTHQSSFAQEINASGIDGLISKLAERNRQLVAKNAG